MALQQIDSDTFDSFIANEGKSVVQFSANWCGPCKLLTKTMEVASENIEAQFGKVDIDKNRELAMKFNIRSVPTTIVFENGQAKQTIIGNKSYMEILSFVEEA